MSPRAPASVFLLAAPCVKFQRLGFGFSRRGFNSFLSAILWPFALLLGEVGLPFAVYRLKAWVISSRRGSFPRRYCL